MTIARHGKAFAIAWIALIATACGPSRDHDPASADAYATRMTIVPAPGATLQRVSLPPAALIALRRTDRSDVRVFDGRGKPLPIALVPRLQDAPALHHQIRVPTFPILGSVDALKLTGVSLRIDERQEAHLVGVKGTVQPAPHGDTTVLGTLVDTRAIVDPAVAIAIDVELPRQQPVSFDFTTSDDLSNWSPLARKVIFRTDADPKALLTETVALPAVDLHHRYVRIGWSSSSRLLSPVSIRTATITTAKAGSPERVAVETTAPYVKSPRDIGFSLPTAMPVAAVRIQPSADDGIVPVRLFGRNAPEESWSPLASGTINAAADQRGDTFEIGGGALRTFRIEADKRTAGFSKPPRLTLLLQPLELVVAFNGTPPFTLAAGLSGAENSYLTAREILADRPRTRIADLPSARVSAPAGPAPRLELSPPDEHRGQRLLLWMTLLLGTGVLGFIVWIMARNDTARDPA